MRSKYDFGKTKKQKKTTTTTTKFNFKSSKQIKLSVSQTSEGDDSRTYASIDKSTREAKDIEYEIPVPTQRYVNMSPSENVSKAIGDFLLDI